MDEDLVALIVLTVVSVLLATAIRIVAQRLWRRTPTVRLLGHVPEFAGAFRAWNDSDPDRFLDLARRAYEKVRLAAVRPRHRNALACAEALLGAALHHVGRDEEAVTYLLPAREALRATKERDAGYLEACYVLATHSLAWIADLAGDHAEAVKLADEGLRRRVRNGDRRIVIQIYQEFVLVRANNLFKLGQYEVAAQDVQQCLRLARTSAENDADDSVILARALLAEIAVATGNPVAALPYIEAAVAGARKPESPTLAEALYIQAQVLAALDRPADALLVVTESVELTRQLAEKLPARYSAILADREAALADLQASGTSSQPGTLPQ
ncbi:hypothetical protein AB0H43_23145 [Hamadaea sp. NPDC050747]|uniref:tetratricopeptide repeat protein n=1 Tax=Hamadaea sp. NPDC050747 TaxID=3155789 RepID=UPI003410F637